MQKFDCVIVGFGPVGALLSLFLSRLQLKVAIIDKNVDIYPLPRAIHFDQEVMRIFQMIGLNEKVSAISRVGTRGMHFVDDNYNTLMEREGSPEIGDQGWPKSWYFHQPDLEKVLRNEVKKNKNITPFLGYQVISVDQSSETVSLKGKGKKSQEVLRLIGSILIGCDGANSIVANYISNEHINYGFEEKYLVIDMKVDNRFKKIKKLPDYTVQKCSSKRPVTRCYISKKRRRWEIKILSTDVENEIKKEKLIWSFLSEWIDKKCAVIERAEIYTFKSKISKKWIKDRVIIAGDSAHLSPPFLGQGMCAGMRDVSSLSWRLKSILSGKFRLSPLLAYQNERLSHVSEFIQLAVDCGKIMSDPDIILKSNKKDKGELFDFPRPKLATQLNSECQLSGNLFPQFLEKGVRTDDKLGYRFVLICLKKIEPIFNEAKNKSIHTIVATGQIKDWISGFNKIALLVRPDKYILGSAINNKDLSRLLKDFSHFESN